MACPYFLLQVNFGCLLAAGRGSTDVMLPRGVVEHRPSRLQPLSPSSRVERQLNKEPLQRQQCPNPYSDIRTTKIPLARLSR